MSKPPELMMTPETREVLDRVMTNIGADLIRLEISGDAFKLSSHTKQYRQRLESIPLELRQEAVRNNPRMKSEYEVLITNALGLVGVAREMIGSEESARRPTQLQTVRNEL